MTRSIQNNNTLRDIVESGGQQRFTTGRERPQLIDFRRERIFESKSLYNGIPVK